MASIKKVGTRVQLEIDTLDGGLSTKLGPSKIGLTETPDCLNVVFDDDGSARTRFGSEILNTQAIGSAPIDGLASYNGSMVAWAGGDMYYLSGTTFVTVPSAQSQFASGTKVACEVYQNILFCSEGTNGPYRYEGPSDFYEAAIPTPSACSASGTSAGVVAADTYYFKVSFVNSQSVEGEPGPDNPVTIGASSVIGLTNIPVGVPPQGVAQRKIYRASGTSTNSYHLVGTISDNVTTTFADNTGPTTALAGAEPLEDATAPTPWTTVKLHKDRLFFDDSSDRTILRYTDYTNPFVSQAENFILTNRGDGSFIQFIGQQDDLISALKSRSIWVVQMNNSADDTSWVWAKSPANIGTVGPRSAVEIGNAIFFLGRESGAFFDGRVSGFYLLQGTDVSEALSGNLRTRSIADKIEPDILDINRMHWDDVAMGLYENRIYVAYSNATDTSGNAHIFWFDTSRIGTDGQPGSWSIWDGINASCFVVHDGTLYSGSRVAEGFVDELELVNTYSDRGGAIDSYWWSKEYGGEASIESYIKDFRYINLWYARLGSYNMNVNWRLDGDKGSGDSLLIDLTPGGSLWGTMVWGTGTWGGQRVDFEEQKSLGCTGGRRIQIGFDNQNTVDQAFKVHNFKILMNLRRLR